MLIVPPFFLRARHCGLGSFSGLKASTCAFAAPGLIERGKMASEVPRMEQEVEDGEISGSDCEMPVSAPSRSPQQVWQTLTSSSCGLKT